MKALLIQKNGMISFENVTNDALVLRRAEKKKAPSDIMLLSEKPEDIVTTEFRIRGGAGPYAIFEEV